MAKPLAGMYAALLSGFADDGGFCPERQAAIMSHVGRQGLDGLYIGGSSAESGLMSTEELLDQQRAIAGLRAPEHGRIIAHVGQPSTAASVALARQAAALGFDGVSALPPHAYPFSDEEILAYYAEVAAASELPMIVYEIPLRTGRALPLPLLERIVALPNVVGIKFTSTDLFKLAQLRRAHPDLTVFFGFDEMYHAAGAQGCDGGIGTTYNVLGKLYAALNRAIAAADLAQARSVAGALAGLCRHPDGYGGHSRREAVAAPARLRRRPGATADAAARRGGAGPAARFPRKPGGTPLAAVTHRRAGSAERHRAFAPERCAGFFRAPPCAAKRGMSHQRRPRGGAAR
jgi:N-acetylneuraminate lyase